jgi:FlaA1/EpsC-like NDP-sugar epimerase
MNGGEHTMLDGKRILVTGGTGSLGKVLVRRLLTGEMGTPESVIVFSRDEAKQHFMRLAYLQRDVATDDVIYENFRNVLSFRIGDVRDYASVAAAVRDVDIVFNAAALKQVPACEYFPTEAVRTNILGVSNLVRAIHETRSSVTTVVGVSTDKACKPINVMGMTKAIQERIFIEANILNPDVRIVCVRYGNVLASRGSVIPLFQSQIAQGGPVTITTLVEDLIDGRDISTKVVGIRPGEKIHEILVSEEESFRTHLRGDYYAIAPMLPELLEEADEERAFEGEFSSATHLMTREQLHELLSAYRV